MEASALVTEMCIHCVWNEDTARRDGRKKAMEMNLEMNCTASGLKNEILCRFVTKEQHFQHSVEHNLIKVMSNRAQLILNGYEWHTFRRITSLFGRGPSHSTSSLNIKAYSDNYSSLDVSLFSPKWVWIIWIKSFSLVCPPRAPGD